MKLIQTFLVVMRLVLLVMVSPETAHSGTNPALLNDSPALPFTTGTAMSTAAAESLGEDSGNAFVEMAFSIEKSTVTKSHVVRIHNELAQDLKAIHGLDWR